MILLVQIEATLYIFNAADLGTRKADPIFISASI